MAKRNDTNTTINYIEIMTLNDYQVKAMVTCLPSCMNDVYAINGLTAEVGEINDKVAKWVRKGICRIENNHLVFNTHDEELVAEYQEELAKEWAMYYGLWRSSPQSSATRYTRSAR